jgi:hypothetical protein
VLCGEEKMEKDSERSICGSYFCSHPNFCVSGGKFPGSVNISGNGRAGVCFAEHSIGNIVYPGGIGSYLLFISYFGN